MRKWLFAMMFLIVAAGNVGFIGYPRYDVSYKPVKIASGSTMWEIANAHYHEGANAEKMCFNAYWQEVTDKNKHLQNPKRCLQVGDVVMVPVYKAKGGTNGR